MGRIAAALLLALPALAAAPPPGLEGTWRGVLAGQLHLVLTVSKDGGGYHAMLDSVDQGATLPIDQVTVAGGAVDLAVGKVGASFHGALDAAAGTLKGKWSQSGMAQPLDFARDAAPPPEKHGEPGKPPLDVPVDLRVPEPPTPFRADGRTHLVYELHLANLARRELVLRSVEVSAGGHPLARFAGPDLASAAGRPGSDAAGLDRLRIGGGLSAILYLWVPLPDGPPPTAIEHTLVAALADTPGELTLRGFSVPVRTDPVRVIAAPLAGGPWRAANGPSNLSGHRRALIPVAGRARISQRFAIDWVKPGDDGKTFRGDAAKNESYFAYGARALAVADGVVTEVKDGIPQNVPGPTRAVPITLETIGGNHVLVDLGGNRFAFYAHLQPGSLKVKRGDRVRRGQLLGLVGNSGNSTQPHLHFHLGDASSPLGAEGLPYALESFEARPLPKPGAPPAAAVARTRELPTEDELITFPPEATR